MPEKINVLKDINVGERVAEEESGELHKYFVETDQWQQLYKGETDVIYGAKGSGKSALYTLLNSREGELFDRGILICPAENVRGNTVFSNLISDPPPSELSFKYLWKLYFLIIISKSLREYDIKNGYTAELVEALETASLLPKSNSISALFKAVTNYFSAWINRDPSAIEYALKIDPTTGAPCVSRKTEFKETSEEKNLAEIPIEELYQIAHEGLSKEDIKCWILLDRLDVAFSESPDLEKNALRALFRTYNDLKSYDTISPKIFVRDDVWQRITEGGFTEASHITKTTNINWGENSLLNLAIRRLLNSQLLIDYYKVNPDEVRSDYGLQNQLFYNIFPEKIESGRNPDTFRWMLIRTSDATENTAPRELIHLLDVLRDLQIKKLERGEPEPDGEKLFDRSIFKDALSTVSQARYEQTLLAEYPSLKEYLDQLEGQKCEHSLQSLSSIWGVSGETAENIAKRLVQVGFFQLRGTNGEGSSYWVPFLYRSALDLVQGKSE